MPEPTADSDAGSGKIVVGVDGSAQSKDALRWAGRLSTALGAPIVAVIAWSVPNGMGYGFAYMPENWSPEADAHKIVDDAVDEVFGANRPSTLTTEISHDHPAKALLSAAADATLLIVGSRGHGGFAGLLLGSVSAHCAEHATCPVLVVH